MQSDKDFANIEELVQWKCDEHELLSLAGVTNEDGVGSEAHHILKRHMKGYGVPTVVTPWTPIKANVNNINSYWREVMELKCKLEYVLQYIRMKNGCLAGVTNNQGRNLDGIPLAISSTNVLNSYSSNNIDSNINELDGIPV